MFAYRLLIFFISTSVLACGQVSEGLPSEVSSDGYSMRIDDEEVGLPASALPDTRYFVHRCGESVSFSTVPALTSCHLITTLLTDEAGHPLPYAQSGRTYRYAQRSMSKGNLLLLHGNSAVPARVPFNKAVPSTAKIVQIQTYGTSTAHIAEDHVANVTCSGEPWCGVSFRIGFNGVSAAIFDMPMRPDVTYNVTVSSDDAVSLWVSGFSL